MLYGVWMVPALLIHALAGPRFASLMIRTPRFERLGVRQLQLLPMHQGNVFGVRFHRFVFPQLIGAMLHVCQTVGQ